MNKTDYIIVLCDGTSCLKKDNRNIRETLKKELENKNMLDRVKINISECLGMCDKGPIMIVYPGYIIYGNVKENDIAEIVNEHLINNRPIARLSIDEDHLYNKFYRLFGNIDFFGKQMRITLRNCGIIDPESIEDYLSLRGYEALAKILNSMTPKDVIKEIKNSGLRGRGGAGFPTGIKWEYTANEKNAHKYVICNADEGDPGAFMDRSAIEGDPHTIIEGMIIGGYAVGAQKGVIYIRAEYPLAVKRLEKAIADAKKHGFIGKNIMNTDFNFDLEIRLGAGAFVCGEETALINSCEGKRGIPSIKPPYPAVSGLFGKPTLINNVETWANIPVIILDGSEWFKSLGTEKSKGTKVFALAGNVRNTGLIEVPMGTTIREIVYDIGGGIPNNKKFKAVQTGGPSGGCLPKQYLDTKIDYESLSKAGSIMGSGGMIVMDEDTCMVNLAKFFLEFTKDESCGKCTPCREGTTRMLEILTRIVKGKGKHGDIEKLEELSETIINTSLCGLGQSAPNPVLSTLKHFRKEYEEHIYEKKCSSRICTDLLKYNINNNCVGCGICKKVCPVNAISGEKREKHTIDTNKCVKCGACMNACKLKAINKF